MLDPLSDSFLHWIEAYHQLVLLGVKSAEMQTKILLHLKRFTAFFQERYGHDRLSIGLKRDVLAWRELLVEQGLAPATVNNHMASLSAFTAWVVIQAPSAFALGDPCKGIRELPLPALEPRALSERQIVSLKNICDRLPHLRQLKGRRHQKKPAQVKVVRSNARPWRDRAMVFFLLSTGLRREELITLNLQQLSQQTPDDLRKAKRVRVNEVKGKGQTQRHVFLSLDARQALADYLEQERPLDASAEEDASPLFLSAASSPMRQADGRLSVRSINLILEQIGRLHDAEISDPERHISPLRPHDLRHTFAFQLAQSTGSDAYELERRLGHRSQRYIQRYTNPPEEIAASYIEDF
jgi:integrase